MAGPTRSHALAASMVVLALALAACGGTETVDPPTFVETCDHDDLRTASALDRLDRVQDAVSRWADAPDLVSAKAAAEEARNLVTGPDTLDSGDLDGDGTALGLEASGLLPTATGTPGLASAAADCPLVERDVLGGPWTDPTLRWAIVDQAIDAWSVTNNPFPTLPSHPQRIVGWATLTIRSTTLDEAHEFAGHAQLHVDVARAALEG